MAKKKRKAKKILIFIILILAIAAVIAGVILSEALSKVPSNPRGTVGNTGGNIINEGLFCQDGDRVYFANTLDNYFIYSMDLDGNNQKLEMGVPAKYLNSAGKYLYYNQFSGGSDAVYGFSGNIHGIFRLKKDSKSNTKGFDRTVAGETVLIDDYIYYQHYDNDNGMTLYRVSTNGNDKGEVLPAIAGLGCVIGSDIYYPDQENNFLINVFNTTSLSSNLFLNERMYNPVYDSGYIYFISIDDDYKLYRLSLSDKSKQKLTDDRVDCYNVLGNVVFYQRNSKDAPALIRMASDGTNPAIIASGNYQNINMTSTYTYYHTISEPADMFRVSTTGSAHAEQFIPKVEVQSKDKFKLKQE